MRFPARHAKTCSTVHTFYFIIEEAIAFECDKLTDILCLERQYILYCTTTNVLKWKIPCEFRDSKQELDFNNLNDVGAYKTCCSFRADLVNKSGMTLTSSLTFTMELEHNNTNITCLNGWTGENDACYITMAGNSVIHCIVCHDLLLYIMQEKPVNHSM